MGRPAKRPVGCGRAAKDDNLALAAAVQAALERQGIAVVMSRLADETVGDAARADAFNKAGVDMVLSFDRDHSADAGESGFTLWIPSRCDMSDMHKCADVGDALARVDGGVSYIGLRRGYPGNPAGDWRINRNTAAVSALVKMLFITNGQDNALFDAGLRSYADAVAQGVCRAFGADWREAPADVGADDEMPEESAGEGAQGAEKIGPYNLKREAVEAAEKTGRGYEVVKEDGKFFAVVG